MNRAFIVSGFIALVCTIGHFAMSGKTFLKPMMAAPFDEVPKVVMHRVFRFISVDFVLATIVILAAGFGVTFGFDVRLLVIFVGIHFALYGIVEVALVLSSGIKGGLTKIYLWSISLLIAVFAFIGACYPHATKDNFYMTPMGACFSGHSVHQIGRVLWRSSI